MWETQVNLLVFAFTQNRKTFNFVRSVLIKKHGKIAYQELKKEALERLGYV